MTLPNMYPEVLEAIHLAHEDNLDLEIDCLLYLVSLRDNWSRCAELSNKAGDALQDMGRCPNCGSEMAYHHYTETHTELDGNPVEHLTEVYCPECDIGGEYYQ